MKQQYVQEYCTSHSSTFFFIYTNQFDYTIYVHSVVRARACAYVFAEMEIFKQNKLNMLPPHERTKVNSIVNRLCLHRANIDDTYFWSSLRCICEKLHDFTISFDRCCGYYMHAPSRLPKCVCVSVCECFVCAKNTRKAHEFSMHTCFLFVCLFVCWKAQLKSPSMRPFRAQYGPWESTPNFLVRNIPFTFATIEDSYICPPPLLLLFLLTIFVLSSAV